MLPSESDSTSKVPLTVVSKSEAEIVKELVDSSNKKLSSIGIVLLLLITPPNTCNFFNK